MKFHTLEESCCFYCRLRLAFGALGHGELGKMASKIGVNRRALNNWAAGRDTPSYVNRLKIQLLTGRNMTYFMEGPDAESAHFSQRAMADHLALRLTMFFLSFLNFDQPAQPSKGQAA